MKNAYVHKELVPKNRASATPTGERHGRMRRVGVAAEPSGALAAALSVGPPAGRGDPVARGESVWTPGRTISTIQGIAATTARTAHHPMETRHPAASSTGTATSAGTTVPSCRPVM